MKKSAKRSIIVSAVLAIIMCVSLVAGATFALFTSDSKVNISVSSGKVNVVATIEDLQTYSGKDLTGNAEDDAQNRIFATASEKIGGVNGTFSNGGTATLDQANQTLTLDRMTPGDKVTFDIKVQNNSNVAIQYRTVIKCEEDKGLFSGLNVTIGDASYKGTSVYSKWALLAKDTAFDPDTVAVAIELPSDKGNEYQDTSCKLSYKVEAVQGNAETRNAIYVTPSTESVTFAANSDVYFEAGEYGNKDYTFYNCENVAFIGSIGTKFDRLTIRSYSNEEDSDSLANSTLTVKGFEASIIQIETGDKYAVVEGNVAGNISLNGIIGFGGSKSRCENFTVSNNFLTGGITNENSLGLLHGTGYNGEQTRVDNNTTYGIYVQQTSNLVISGNTFSNIYRSAIGLQRGAGDIEIKNNYFESYGTKYSDYAALKIWDSQEYSEDINKYIGDENGTLNENAQALYKTIKDNNTFSKDMLDKLTNDSAHYFLANITYTYKYQETEQQNNKTFDVFIKYDLSVGK